MKRVVLVALIGATFVASLWISVQGVVTLLKP